MSGEEVKIAVVREDDAYLPEYETLGAAGMDVRIIEDAELQPMERALIRTGLKIAVPIGYEAQIRPRSGMALKKGIAMANTPGTIDSDYRGEVKLIVINFSKDVVKLSKGERVAQMVIAPVVRAVWEETDSLPDTSRGEGGFGSTGTA